MIRVFYDSNAIFIDTIRLPVVAGTLVANAISTEVIIENIHSAQPVVSADYTQIGDINGTMFDSVADCLTYLNGQFQMRRSLDIPTATGIAAVDIAQGTPVAILRSSQQLTPARADTYALSFVVGMAATDIASGFSGNTTRVPVTLSDWTAIAGSASLSSGQPYFLALSGGMTPTVPDRASVVCSTRVGIATSSQTFLFQQADPILL